MVQDFTVVYFPGLILSNNLAFVSGMIPPASTTGNTLPIINPCFFIGNDLDGSQILCAFRMTNSQITVQDTLGNNIKGTLAPVTATAGVLVGGHPIHRPK